MMRLGVAAMVMTRKKKCQTNSLKMKTTMIIEDLTETDLVHLTYHLLYHKLPLRRHLQHSTI